MEAAATVRREPSASYAKITNQTAADKAWVKFQREKLNVHYLSTDQDVRKAYRWVQKLDPSEIALDFETVFYANGWANSTKGALRLIQIGIDQPERGIEPVQFLIDCYQVDPRPFNRLLQAPTIETDVHNMNFEFEWAKFHLGVEIGGIYDTMLAFREINKKLKKMDPEEAQLLVPGWEPHGNDLGTLVSSYQQMRMPKEEGGSNWGRKRLLPKQLVYAACDVAVMPPVTATAKHLAEKLDVTDDVNASIERAKGNILARTERNYKRNGDSLVRCRRSMERAQSRQELHKAWRASLQMPIRADRRVELDRLLKQLEPTLH